LATEHFAGWHLVGVSDRMSRRPHVFMAHESIHMKKWPKIQTRLPNQENTDPGLGSSFLWFQIVSASHVWSLLLPCSGPLCLPQAPSSREGAENPQRNGRTGLPLPIESLTTRDLYYLAVPPCLADLSARK